MLATCRRGSTLTPLVTLICEREHLVPTHVARIALDLLLGVPFRVFLLLLVEKIDIVLFCLSAVPLRSLIRVCM
jgi:hypothetical protein